MFTAVVLVWLGVSVASSTAADRRSVTHECASDTAVSVSPSLTHLIADRRLLSTAGRAYTPRTHRHRSPSAVLSALLLLLGGVESNPGPAAAAATPSNIAVGLLVSAAELAE